jgi:hypothetical protein
MTTDAITPFSALVEHWRSPRDDGLDWLQGELARKYYEALRHAGYRVRRVLSRDRTEPDSLFPDPGDSPAPADPVELFRRYVAAWEGCRLTEAETYRLQLKRAGYLVAPDIP